MENLSGGSFTGDPEGCVERLWRRASLPIGALQGNLEGSSFTRDFERWMKGTLGVENLSLFERAL
jgi:hypothetical protein